MSETESFESVMEAAMPLLSGDCVFESCPDENDDCMHCAIHMADRLRRAYDREIRDTAQQQYHRGFEAGRRSMDAEHRAISMRLRGLRFDGGSHENLSRVAYAIYPCATGWTCESAAGLRDRLIDLMGGVSDENVHVGGLRCDDGCMGDVSNGEDTGRTHDSPSNLDRNHMAVRVGVDTVIGDSDDTCDSQRCGACAADCGGDSGVQERVKDGGRDSGKSSDVPHGGRRGIHRLSSVDRQCGLETSDGGTADDCGADTGCGSCGGDLHMAGVTYDLLWNERHEAVRVLRKLLDRNTSIWNTEISIALGLNIFANNAAVCRRLIHLLGGDQPSGIDVLREMDAESDDDGTCPNDVPTSSITDELRKFTLSPAMTQRLAPDEQKTARSELQAIADRIDEQFDRICQQQEAVLQSIIDEVIEERKSDQLRIEKLEKQRDEARAKLDAITAALNG